MPIQIGVNNAIKGSPGTGTGSGGSGGVIPPPPINYILQQDLGKITLQNGTGFLITQ